MSKLFISRFMSAYYERFFLLVPCTRQFSPIWIRVQQILSRRNVFQNDEIRIGPNWLNSHA